MANTINSFLTFRLGDEVFASSVSNVIEILEVPRITKVPRSPDFMRGVINLRGNVLSVVDTRIKFGLPQVADTINTCIIVVNVNVEGQDMTVGLIVDAVKEVIELDNSQIQNVPEIGSRYKSEFIDGMVKSGDQFVMIVKINHLISSADASMLQDIVQPSAEQIAH